MGNKKRNDDEYNIILNHLFKLIIEMEKVPELDIFSRSLSKRKSSLSKFNHHGSSHSSGFGISNTLDYSASSSGFSKSSYHNNNYYQ